MASFTESVKILIDVVTKGGTDQLKSLKTEIDNTEGGFSKAKVAAGGFGDFVKSNMGVAVAGGVAGAATAIAGFAVKAAGDFQDLALKVDNFTQKTGVSAEQASRWIEVSGDLGVEADAVATAFGRFEREDASGALAQYGLTATDASGRFAELLGKIGSIPDENERAAAAFKVFGKSWQSLAPLLDGTEDLNSRLKEVSGQQIITSQQVGEARDFRDNLDDLNDRLEKFTTWVGEKAVAAVNSLIKKANEIGGPIADLAQGIKDTDDATGNLASNGLKLVADRASHFYDVTYLLTNGAYDLGDAVGALSTGFGLWGDSADDASNKTVVLGSSIRAAQVDEREFATQTAAAAKASDDAAKASEMYDAALEKTAKSLRDAAKAQQEQVDAERAAADAFVALGKANDDYQIFLDGLNKQIVDAQGNQQALNEINRQAVDKATRVADAVTRVNDEQATANGTTVSATQKLDNWNGSMLGAASRLNGDVRNAVLGYIANVNGIPPEKITDIQAALDNGDIETAERILNETSRARTQTTTADANTAQAEAELNYVARDRQSRVFLKQVGPNGEVAGGYAEGGDVAAGEVAWVGEKGRELVAFGESGHVFTHAESEAMTVGRSETHGTLTAAGGGDVYNITNNIYMPPGSDGDDVVRSLKRYERNNGSVPIKTR